MVSVRDSNEFESFLVTKHSWKGKYKRILTIGSTGVTTYNPDKYEATNKWNYSDVMAVVPNKTPTASHEFSLILRKDRKSDTVKLSSEFRNDIITSILKYHKDFAEKPKPIQKYQAYKHHWSGISFPTVLEVTPCSLDQLDPTTNTILASYNYKDINGIIGIGDYEGGIVIAYDSFIRLHVFKALNHHEIVQNIVQCASQFLGIDIKVPKGQITLDHIEKQKFGTYSKDESLTSLSEFTVQKITHRHPEPTKRILCLTDTAILERDPQTYSVCTLRPLIDIFALIRDLDNIQMFCIEYKSGQTRSYLTNDRDSLLATLLDAVRSCGNQDVHVRISRTPRAKRMVPLSHSVDEETEANLLKLVIHNFQYPIKRFEILERFNANVLHTGLNYSVTQDSLFAENKEKLILGALQALTQKDIDSNNLNNLELEATFHALRRLLASKVGFAAFTNMQGFREKIGQIVIASLRRNDLAVTYAAIDMINSLMHSMNADYDLKQEQLNKSSLLSSKSFLESLLDMWTLHVSHGSGTLVLSAMLDFLTFALCIPYSETTDSKQFDTLLEMVASRGRYLFKLFQHSSLAIVKGAGLILRALIEEGDAQVANQMQTLALNEAALCRHLLVALYTPSNDPTMVTHRQLSRHLVGLWITDNEDAMNLLRRIFPAGLLMFLESEDSVPKSDVEEDKLNFRDNLKLAIQHSSESKVNIIEKHLEGIKHWGLNLIDRQEKINRALRNRPIVLRNRRQKKKLSNKTINLPLFFYQFQRDHNIPNLIWNHKTREELRSSLENELRQFTSDKEISGNILVAWNYEEFEVQYNCLADELKIGDYYIMLILEKDDWPQNLVKDPVELFNALYRRVLCRNRINDDQQTIISLQALAKVYKRYEKEIGCFSDMTYILQLLDRCLSPSLRDALIGLIKCLTLNKSNCRPLVDYVSSLVDLITLAHLHKGRATLNSKTNVIDAAPGMQILEEKDWYYNIEKNGEKPQRCGPVSFSELKDLWNNNEITPRTRCWAPGMDGWRALQQVPQFKWCLMAKGTPLYNETELAAHILDILIKCTSFFPSRAKDGKSILIPGPKLSRKISEFICLPHIVQVCLTHDPALLERVATLLCQIMEDNPDLPKVYLNGVFYFMLMYTGSNILPVARFLKMAHMKQAFRDDDATKSEIMHRSILGQLLPEAMVCFLENHSAEKFAETFLGEFDTPEVIWNSEMRRLLIEKIAAHIADFTPRLKGHTMARYSYLAIPVIIYPQLKNELFCHIFYLRHLCDTKLFPNWPIAEPVLLLKETLEAWRKEVEKKPSLMTVQQAYADLCIDTLQHPNPDEAMVRKTYYKLAQMYHPDKNPKGREVFVRVNLAYEFLCSRSAWNGDGPNPSNIVLILRTQSILFERYADELRPYKYAGYPQLIKTIQLETKDEQLFSKEVPLLTAASELCYHTVHCSALNAEELRRENGIEALLEAYTRCVSIMSNDSKPNQVHYQIISNITKCFEVACNFENCKNKILELPQLVADVCRVVYFKHSISVSLVASLAANNIDLQNNLVKCGVIWSLLMFLFEYDYTLDEGGIETEEKTNQQKFANNLAKLSILSLVSLAGYELKLISSQNDQSMNSTCTKTAAKTDFDGSPQSNSAMKAASQTINSPTSTSSYSTNASNPLQNNRNTIGNSSNEKSNFKSYVNLSASDRKLGDQVETGSEPENNIEKENVVSNKKYIIGSTASNVMVKKMLDKLLTEFISNKLASDSENEVLKLLTSNTRNPYLIWDNSTRAQLLDFLEHQRLQSSKHRYEDIMDVHEVVNDFSFETKRDEIQIGGVYIRIYNEMPTFPIQNPKSLIIDLLDFLKQGYQYFIVKRKFQKNIVTMPHHSDKILQPTLSDNHPQRLQQQKNNREFDGVLNEYNRSKAKSQIEKNLFDSSVKYDFDTNPNAVDHLIMVLRALIAVTKSNPNVEIQFIGHFEILFTFLSANWCNRDGEIKTFALELVSLVSRNKECVSEIAACELLGLFLLTLRDTELKPMQEKVLDTLSGLLNVQRMIKEAHNKGAVIYLLDLFCNSRNPQIREKCAELLGKMTADKLTGPKVRISVGKFLPSVFLDAMIESPAISVQMFESIHEHPELVWNDRTRSSVIESISDTVVKFNSAQKENPLLWWKDSDTLEEIQTNELVVCGVYLKLFISNPGWTLRKPKQFLSDLLDFVVDNINRTSIEKDVLDTSTTALVCLLNAQPNLADAVPVLGHIPKFFRQLSVQPKSALRVLHQLSLSEVCVAAISQTECINSMKKCMENNKELMGTACETLCRLFKCQHDSLIRQSLECNLIPYLINLLDSQMEFADNPAMVKAQIVSALKAMTHSLNYGDQVSHILNSNPIWAEYKDQKHDLFITSSHTRAYLTGVNQNAGYLTQGASKNMEVLTSPPPIDRDDPLVRKTE